MIDRVLVGRFFCEGRPRTKGSMKPQPARGKGGRMVIHMVESGEYSVPWKRSMIAAIKREAAKCATPHFGYTGAVEVESVFRFEREIGADGAVWPSHDEPYPTAMDLGDWDKLSRNLLDALTQSGMIKDDRLVIGSSGTWKRWCRVGELPGVEVSVYAARDPEEIP